MKRLFRPEILFNKKFTHNVKHIRIYKVHCCSIFHSKFLQNNCFPLWNLVALLLTSKMNICQSLNISSKKVRTEALSPHVEI